MAIKSFVASSQSFSILDASENRKGVCIYNASNQPLYVSLGETDTEHSDYEYTVMLGSHSYYEVPASYTGEIFARAHVGSNGAIKVTNW